MKLKMREYETGDIDAANWGVDIPNKFEGVAKGGTSLTGLAGGKVAIILTVCLPHPEAAMVFALVDDDRIVGYEKSVIIETLEAMRVFSLVSGVKKILTMIEPHIEKNVVWANKIGFKKLTSGGKVDLYIKDFSEGV